jgi:hypothetical protein
MSQFFGQRRLAAALNFSRGEGWLVSLTLGLVVLAWTLDSALNPAITSTDLNMSATIVAKDQDASLYPRDNLFSDEALVRFYTPLYREIIARTWQLGGTFEAGLIWLVPPVLSLYLIAMFVLLRYVTGQSWIALALTVASAHYHDTMGAGVWGVGGSAELMPRALFMPVIPLLALIFLERLGERPDWLGGVGLGLILGLATNLHPVSGFHGLVLLLASLLLLHGRRWPDWLTAGGLGLMAIIGAWPVTANYLQNSGQAVAGTVDFASFSRIVAERYSLYFFPATFRWPLFNLELGRPLLDGLAWFYLVVAVWSLAVYLWGRQRWPALERWTLLLGGLISLAYAHMIVLFDTTFLFAVVAWYVIDCFRRGVFPRLSQWLLALTGLIVLYAFAGYYFLSLLWQNFALWPLTSLLIEYARAGRYVYLPLYLLAGQAGLALVQLVAERWPQRLPLARETTGPVVLVALPLGLGPGVGRAFAANLGALLLAVVGLLLLAGLLVGSFGRLPRSGALAATVLTMLLLLFGPLAPWAAKFLPVPAHNLLQPANWASQPVAPPADSALYAWTRQNTAADALFYGCFGSTTMTYFRRHTQRSITHNWKDLAYNVHNRATLLPAYAHYRELETSCQDFTRLLETGRAVAADYLLVARAEAENFIHEACFSNERYAVFALKANGCRQE